MLLLARRGSNYPPTYLWDTMTGKITATLADLAIQGAHAVEFGQAASLAVGDFNGTI